MTAISTYTPPVLSSTTTTTNTTPTTDPANPMQASTFKRISDSVGEFFSGVADTLHFGQTYKLIEREFRQIDFSGGGDLNYGEFMLGTMNPFDFGHADTNADNKVSLSEYVDYRKTTLGRQFDSKDQSGDGFLNVAEVGTVGRLYLAQRDPRLDANKDGLLNKREFIRSHLTFGISIRDLLGL